jgi:prepilin signal peptidase PulO-like enzyme (type II secretory pathway)
MAIHYFPDDDEQNEQETLENPVESPIQADNQPEVDHHPVSEIAGMSPQEVVDYIQSDDEPRPVIAWLGITAFLFGKRTSPEGVKLGWRYPITEIFTAFMMVLAVAATWDDQELSLIQLVFFLVYMAIFSLITVIDIEHKLILFVVIIPSLIIALIDATLLTYAPSLRDALIGGAFGFGVFFILYNGGFLFTYIMGALRGERINEVAFGYGDVMLATLSGVILGWRALIFAMFITVFLGAFGALVYLVSRSLLGSKYSAFTALPYGPYIIIGTTIMLLFSAEVAGVF